MRLTFVPLAIALVAFVCGIGNAANVRPVYGLSLLYTKAPAAAPPFTDIPVLYAADLWPDRSRLNAAPEDKDIDSAVERKVMEAASFAVIDIEHWPLRDSTGTPDPEIIKRLITVLNRCKKLRPEVRWGFYGLVPARDYWRAIDEAHSERYRQWQYENDKIKPLADASSALFPSIYTFYESEQNWVKYAEAQISEARRLAPGKHVLPFLWPRYHKGDSTLDGAYIPPTFWSRQLRTVMKNADGFVIWGGWQEPWDSMAPWWTSTRIVVREDLMLRERQSLH